MFTFVTSALLFATIVKGQSPLDGQCGGEGWTGPTTCSSGVCTYSNPYYSQCLPASSGTTTKTTTTTATTTQSTPASTCTANSVPTKSGAPVTTFFGGVNLRGFDFEVYDDGSYEDLEVPPSTGQVTHFLQEGVNLFRIPFAWQLATPTLGGNLSASWFTAYNGVVQAALSGGAHVIIDVQNYARWNGSVIGEPGGPTNAQFVSLWSQLAVKSQPNIIFGIMNAPHDLISLTNWVSSVQAAVNAIRAAGAKSQLILIPGTSYASAQALPTEAGPCLLNVIDTDGTKSKLIFEVQKWLDSDNSGSHPDCVTDNTAVLQGLVNWLQKNGGRQALLTETGGSSTSSCQEFLKSELSFIKANSKSIIGFCIWAAGPASPIQPLDYSVSPNPNGTDQPIWTNAVLPNLP